MATENKKKQTKQNTTNPQNKQKATQNAPKPDFLSLWSNWAAANNNKLLLLIMLIALIFSLLLFDIKVSLGGDDASYIIRAYDFWNNLDYPSFQGPLYPMVLSPLIGFSGINLPILKFSSMIFLLLSIYFMYLSYKGKINALVLFIGLFILSGNAYLLYFSVHTYSEAFYMMLQAMLFWAVFKTCNNSKKNQHTHFATIGLILISLFLTKSVGLAAFMAVLTYYLIQKEYKSVLFSSAYFGGFMILWEIIKRLVWKTSEVQFSSQASTLMLKHPYDTTKGMEDFAGYFIRFIDNSNIYLSKHLFTFLGFRPEISDIQPILTILLYTLFVATFILIFHKNKYLLFTGIYLIFLLGVTFVALQTIWDGRRLIAPFYPFILIFLLSGIYELFQLKKVKMFLFLFPLIAIILLVATYKISFEKIDDNSTTLQENLKGNVVFGLTPDWQNFINMSKWAAANTDKNVMIASRKPSISFVYTGRRFYGIYSVPSLPVDSLKSKCERLPHNYTIIDASQWEQKTHLQSLYLNIQRYNIGYITEFWKRAEATSAETSIIFEVYEMPDSAIALFDLLKQNALSQEFSFDKFFSNRNLNLQKNPGWTIDYVVTDPDNLLQNLYENKVKYLVMANLRKHEQQKTQFTINTVRRYLFYIQRKYPSKVKLIHTIGHDEQAYLFEIL
jgi:hypothetical protein